MGRTIINYYYEEGEQYCSPSQRSITRKLWVIPAVRKEDTFNLSLKAYSPWIFLLFGSIYDLKEFVIESHRINKKIFVHLDLIQGLGKDETGIKYLKEFFNVDGIITTKGNVIEWAKKEKLITILRIFLLDSLAITTGIELAKNYRPDYVELLPGVIPKSILYVREKLQKYNIPIITGGLIESKEEIEKAIQSGAIGVSTSKTDLWSIL
jgi:glycerol uptake operon antiterminator